MAGRARRAGPQDPLARLRVLESVPQPGAQTNPYISQLLRSLRAEEGVQLLTFTWRRALTARYEVFHVHWPDALLSARSPLRRAAKCLLFGALLLRLRVSRVTVVRTLHNSEPHERRRGVDVLEWRLTRMTDAVILLSAGDGASGVVIPHGHYRDWFAPFSRRTRVQNRMLFVGHIRPYKGIPELLRAFRGLALDDASLVVAGSPRHPDLTAQITNASAADPRITRHLRYVPDDELVELVTSSQLVVLPYEKLENSGVALAALSLDRPVLMPRTPSSEMLAAEVGEEWALLFTPPLTAETLSIALSRTAAMEMESPRFADRDWEATGARHRAVFAEARTRRNP